MKRSRGRTGGVAAGSVIAVLVLLLLLFSEFAVSAAGASPVAPAAQPTAPAPLPNPSSTSVPAQDASSYATSTAVNAYEEDVSLSTNLTVTKPSGSAFVLQKYHQALKFPYTGSLHSVATSAVTWLNLTHGCSGSARCAGSYACGPGDGYVTFSFLNPPPSHEFTRPCFALYLNWTYSGTLPTYASVNITRAQAFVAVQNQTWLTQGTSRVDYANVTSYGDGMYDVATSSTPAPASVSFSTWLVTWWVPYPAGNWYLAGTTFDSVDYSTVYPQTDYAILSGAFVVEWAGYPADSGTNYVYHYQFTLAALSTGGGGGGCIVNCGGGGGSGGTGGNGSGIPPGAPPNPAPQLGELVLTLGNVTPQAGGGFESSLIYTNLYAYNLTCEILLEASWLVNAVNVTVYANSVPLPVFDRGISPTLITIWSGVVTIDSGSSASFSATYKVASSFSFYGTMFYLGSSPVTIWNIVATGALVAVAFAVWWDVRNPSRSRLQDAIVGVGMFSLFVIAVVTL